MEGSHDVIILIVIFILLFFIASFGYHYATLYDNYVNSNCMSFQEGNECPEECNRDNIINGAMNMSYVNFSIGSIVLVMALIGRIAFTDGQDDAENTDDDES